MWLVNDGATGELEETHHWKLARNMPRWVFSGSPVATGHWWTAAGPLFWLHSSNVLYTYTMCITHSKQQYFSLVQPKCVIEFVKIFIDCIDDWLTFDWKYRIHSSSCTKWKIALSNKSMSDSVSVWLSEIRFSCWNDEVLKVS